MSRESTPPQPHQTLRRFGALTLVSCLIAGLAACGGDSEPTLSSREITSGDLGWDQIVDAANEEGAATFYLSTAGREAEIEAAFEKAYPEIDLTVVRQGTGEQVRKVETEFAAGGGGGDVLQAGARGFFRINSDKFIPLVGPSASLYEGTKSVEDDGRYYISTLMPTGFAVNSEKLQALGADEIKTFDDLLQPELNGRMGAVDPGASDAVLERAADEAGRLGTPYMEELAKQKVRIFDGTGALTQAVASGEIVVGVNSYSGALVDIQKAGAPVEYVEPESAAYAAYEGIPQSATHPAAAQVLHNWLLSKEGQEVQQGWGYTGSGLPDVAGAWQSNDETVIYDGEISEDQAAYLDTWNSLFR